MIYLFENIFTKYLKIIVILLSWYLFCMNNILIAQIVGYKHYSIKDGLSQIEIKCIFQDSEGFMWIGTQNGLNKFDGYYFENIFNDPTDSTSISSNWIFGITEDCDGNLWFGTKEGLNKYDKINDIFTRVNYKNENSVVSDDYIYSLASDSCNIYINTPPSLSILNYKTGKLKVYNNNIPYDGILYDFSYPILVSKDGLIWLGSEKGLYYFNPKNQKFYNFSTNNSNRISHNHITALCEDSFGNILIGTEKGLNIYNPGTKIIKQYFHDENNYNSLSHNFIRSIVSDYTGAYWVGTEEGGLNKIEVNKETGELSFTSYRSEVEGTEFISHDIVFSLYEDKSCNLWIGTLAGLNKVDLKRKKYRVYKKAESPGSVDLLDNFIASVYEEDDLIWIGNWGKGLNLYNKNTNKVIHYLSSYRGKRNIPNNYVHVLFKDSKSRFWLGTRNGLSIFNDSKKRFIPFDKYFKINDSGYFINNRVYCITEDSSGEIWIGTGNGICVFNPETKHNIIFREGNLKPFDIAHNLVYSILEDRDKHIWIATSDGLDMYDPEKNILYHYKHNPNTTNTLCYDFTISLCEDKFGDIWIGTSTGVNSFNKKDSVFSYYSTKNGLPSNIVYNIIEDNNNDLWFTTGKGLAKYSIDSKTFKTYSFEEELEGGEFNLKAVFKSEEGEMFFGSVGGLLAFHPDSLSDSEFIPPIVITSFSKEQEGIRSEKNIYKEEIKLSYKDYAFTIKFASLDYTNPRKNMYAYKMQGLTDEWVDLGNRRSVHFTSLSPGKYVFSVKGTNHDGVWNDIPTSIKIQILPPWWRSNYAYFMYVVIFIVLIISIIKLREKNLIKEKRVLDNKIKERTKEIALQKEKLNELNITKDKFFSILAHDLKNPFSSLYSMSEIVCSKYKELEEGEKVLALKKIHKSAKLIYNLLENLLTWSNSQRGRIEYNPSEFNLSKLIDQNINLHRQHADKKGVEVINKNNNYFIAFGDRQMINTVLRNLINNAIKFTKSGGKVEVIIERKENYYEVQVRDEGIGISDENREKLFRIDQKFKSLGTDGEKGTGLGLLLCREFVEKGGGNIWCNSIEGEGSSFYFTIPLGNE